MFQNSFGVLQFPGTVIAYWFNQINQNIQTDDFMNRLFN